MSNNKLESILELLTPFNNPNIPLTPIALKRLNHKAELNEFYNFLITPSKILQNDISRPICPVKDIYHSSLARAPYKNAMAGYIAQWGYKFMNPVNMAPSLLEATANYLEKE